MAFTLSNGYHNITPGACRSCGSAGDWHHVDAGGGIECACVIRAQLADRAARVESTIVDLKSREDQIGGSRSGAEWIVRWTRDLQGIRRRMWALGA